MRKWNEGIDARMNVNAKTVIDASGARISEPRKTGAQGGSTQNEITRVRLEYGKGDAVRFLGHLDVARVMRMALFRAGWPLRMSKGFSPRPKVAFYSPLPVGTSGESEHMDVELEGAHANHLEDLVKRLTGQIPKGFSLAKAYLVDPAAPSLESEILASEYRISWKGGIYETFAIENRDEMKLEIEKETQLEIEKETQREVEKEAQREIGKEIEKGFSLFEARDCVLFEVERPSGKKTVDLRPILLAQKIKCLGGSAASVGDEKAAAEGEERGSRGDEVIIHMTLKHENGRTVRPEWILSAVTDLNPWLKGRMDPKEAMVHRTRMLFDLSTI